MLSFVRRRLTFGNVVLTLALVFAMSGGAFAAGKFLITSTKQIKPSVLAQLKGKAGPAGDAGAQGPAGPVGPTGPTGAAGTVGPKGETGVEGKEGKAGKDGKNGTTGFTETLPSKKTETGLWVLGLLVGEPAPYTNVSISFPIPLASPLGKDQVHYINLAGEEVIGSSFPEPPLPTQPSTECLGTAAKPSAEPGNLCIYETGTEDTQLGSESIFNPATPAEGSGQQLTTKPGASTSGALALFKTKSGSSASGTWAVTAE